MMDSAEKIYTPAEVAAIFSVDPKTVSKWAAQGRLDSFRTPGGHRRFRESEIRRFTSENTGAVAPAADAADGEPLIRRIA